MSKLNQYGPSSRLAKTQQEYVAYTKQQNTGSSCVFCDESQIDIRQNFHYFRVLGNRFPYETWDDHHVTEHLMLAPISHSGHIKEFNDEEKREYLELLAEFELQGYSIYSRAPVDITRSVDHFHTHLIKVGRKPITAMLYLRKPHLVLRRFGRSE